MLHRPIVLLALVALPAFAQSATAASERTASGSFTEDQAVKGETAFRSFCASCHTVEDHTNDKFRHDWFGRTVYDLYKMLRTTMPDDNPGGLSDDEYTRVIAYILKLNGFKPGTDSLLSDTTLLKRVRISDVADSAQIKPPSTQLSSLFSPKFLSHFSTQLSSKFSRP